MRHGFQIASSGSWGNLECVVANLREWTVYQPGKHSLHNDPRYPLVVWVLAGIA